MVADRKDIYLDLLSDGTGRSKAQLDYVRIVGVLCYGGYVAGC